MLLGGWGSDYKKEFFLGRSTVPLPPDVLAEFVSHLRPSLVETETKVANKLMELNALPKKEKQWQCNQKIRTYLADMQKSVQAQRRLLQVFLYGLPLLVAQFTAERLVVVRGSRKVQQLLQDARFKEYNAHVKHGHRNALERIELARLPLEERMEAQQQRLAMCYLSQATTAMPAGSRAQFVTSLTCAADESGSKNQQAPIANLPEAALVKAKSGVLHFADLTTVEHAFNEWPKIETQVEGCGGWKNCQNKAETTTTSDVIWFSVLTCSWNMGCRQHQHVGFTHIYNSKGASLWQNCAMLSTLLSRCPIAKPKEVDRLAGKTLT